MKRILSILILALCASAFAQYPMKELLVLAQGQEEAPAATGWQVEYTTPTNGTQIILRFTGSTNLWLDWGDGNSEVFTATALTGKTNFYTTAGTYIVTITGRTSSIIVAPLSTQSRECLTRIINPLTPWVYGINSFLNFASSATNLTYAPTDMVDAESCGSVTTIRYIFGGCESLTNAPNLNMLTNCTILQSAFYYTPSLKNIPLLPTNSAISDVAGAVRQSGATNAVPEYWNAPYSVSSFANFGTGSTNLSNYGDIPDAWKGF